MLFFPEKLQIYCRVALTDLCLHTKFYLNQKTFCRWTDGRTYRQMPDQLY